MVYGIVEFSRVGCSETVPWNLTRVGNFTLVLCKTGSSDWMRKTRDDSRLEWTPAEARIIFWRFRLSLLHSLSRLTLGGVNERVHPMIFATSSPPSSLTTRPPESRGRNRRFLIPFDKDTSASQVLSEKGRHAVRGHNPCFRLFC